MRLLLFVTMIVFAVRAGAETRPMIFHSGGAGIGGGSYYRPMGSGLVDTRTGNYLRPMGSRGYIDSKGGYYPSTTRPEDDFIPRRKRKGAVR
jgi:hypothetical protein